MPSLVVWVPAALVRLNCVGSSEAPSTWQGSRGQVGLWPGTDPRLIQPRGWLRCPPAPQGYLGTAPGRAGAVATDTHAEALEAAVGVVGAQVEGAFGTLIAQAPHHIVLQAQIWELQDGPLEGLPGAAN